MGGERERSEPEREKLMSATHDERASAVSVGYSQRVTPLFFALRYFTAASTRPPVGRGLVQVPTPPLPGCSQDDRFRFAASPRRGPVGLRRSARGVIFTPVQNRLVYAAGQQARISTPYIAQLLLADVSCAGAEERPAIPAAEGGVGGPYTARGWLPERLRLPSYPHCETPRKGRPRRRFPFGALTEPDGLALTRDGADGMTTNGRPVQRRIVYTPSTQASTSICDCLFVRKIT
jgi:hypothetical protein